MLSSHCRRENYERRLRILSVRDRAGMATADLQQIVTVTLRSKIGMVVFSSPGEYWTMASKQVTGESLRGR
jgi:hypothetical protein